MPSSDVYSLSIHADYRCRHSGRCCSVDWDVPVELPVYRSLTEAMTAGRLQAAPDARSLPAFTPDPGESADAAAIFGRRPDGACVFFERESRLCVVHRDLGDTALAVTCRTFPRVAIQDARGTSVALSHFCPTAASLLFRDDVPLAVVSAPPAFPPADYDGLTVNGDEFPPLLQPRMLMDHDAYAAWERHMVGRCVDVSQRPESVLATLRRDAELLAPWRPGGAGLCEAVGSLPADVVQAESPSELDDSLHLFAECMTAVPDDLRPAPDEQGLVEAYQQYVVGEWHRFHAPLNRYIAAKAFATWTAYQGRGVRSIVRGIEAAVALVRVEASRECRDAGRPLDAALLLEAFRSADFLLNHLAGGDVLAENWSRVEK